MTPLEEFIETITQDYTMDVVYSDLDIGEPWYNPVTRGLRYRFTITEELFMSFPPKVQEYIVKNNLYRMRKSDGNILIDMFEFQLNSVMAMVYGAEEEQVLLCRS